MLMIALAVNIAVLVPVLASIQRGAPAMTAAFGADTDARRILTCVYGAIAIVSAGLLVLFLADHDWAAPMTVGLFAVQIIYKTGTVFLVGFASPVVVTNTVIVAVQICALATYAFGAGLVAG